MKFVRLNVEHFRCIVRADLEFGPGLNVMFGPNELGKTSLVDALRAVLLLPPNSSKAENYFSWSGPHRPSVSLLFRTGEREFWRVEKKFGEMASELGKSLDGASFQQEARGRDVDGRIRDLLSLGIPEPGGRAGRLKGLPSSFLTEVLFPRQDAVTGLFDQSLAGDPSDSGRRRLVSALEAMAQDPFFKRVLQATHAKVEEGFTPTGQKKRGASSPFSTVKTRIEEAQRQVDDYQAKAGEGETVQEQIRLLSEARAELVADRDGCAKTLALLKTRLADQAHRAKIEDALRAAGDRETRCRGIMAACDEAQRSAADFQTRLEKAQAELAGTEANVESARLARQDTEEHRRRVESQEDVKSRELEIARLKQQLTDLQQRWRDAERDRDRAEAAAAVARQSAELERLQERAKSDDERLREAKAQRQLLGGVACDRDRQEAEARLKKADDALAKAASLRAEAAGKHVQASALKSSLEARRLPDAAALKTLQRLENDLRVARASLDVGLSVEIRPRKGIELTIGRDGEAPQRRTLREPAIVEADRQVDLGLPELGEISITGGRPDARRKADDLRDRWSAEAAPVLEAAGAGSLDQVAESCAAAEQDRRRLATLLVEAQQRARDAQTQETLADDRGRLRSSIQRAQEKLSGLDDTAIRAESNALFKSGVSVEDAIEDADGRIARLAEEASEAGRSLATAQAMLRSSRETLARLCSGDAEAARRAAGDHAAMLSDALGRLKAVDAEKMSLDRKIAETEQAGEAALTEARKVEAQAKQGLELAETGRTAARKGCDAIQQELASWKGKLEERRREAETVDLDAAIAAREKAQKELSCCGTGSSPVSERDIADAQSALERADQALNRKENDIASASGQLQQIGGETVRERCTAALERLGRLRQEEADLHLEYDAWMYLRGVLEEVEKQEAVHLGETLREPVGEKLRSLTGGRCDRLILDQHLKTEGVSINGDERAVEDLSAGTRDQVSTLLRLTLAEHLGMAIVLDDQLVHSDPQRIAWFRDTLRNHASQLQILVFTCRPLDYVNESEVPEPGRPVAEYGNTRVVNLEAVVRGVGQSA